MRVAIACSGLGHVARGIETWAASTGAMLAARGVDVTLFSAANQPLAPYERCLRSRRRGDPLLRRTARWMPGFTWRWGLKSAYQLEQKSFWGQLFPELKRGNYDILHVQDPWLAVYCRQAREAGLLQTREILAHGTEESLEFLRQFPFLQHLAPWHLEQAAQALEAELGEAAAADLTRDWQAIPNFVDCQNFAPTDDHATIYRQQAGIAADARVFCCAASVKVHHKRLDYLIREFSHYLKTTSAAETYLFIAGSSNPDSQALVDLANQLAGDRIRIFLDLPHEQMRELYRSANAFVLTSLFEMMPIAVLEALAMGLPMIVHRHPVLQWMIGEGGAAIDLSQDGGLSRFLAESVDAAWLERHARLAREQAVNHFSVEVVADRYLAYYQHVLEAEPWQR